MAVGWFKARLPGEPKRLREVAQGSRGDPFRDRLLLTFRDRLLLTGTPIASAPTETTEMRDRLRGEATEDSVESSDGFKEVDRFVSVVDAFCPKRLRTRVKRGLKPII
jgi:hypothetical protein